MLLPQGDRLEEDWVPEQDERPAEEVEKEAAAAEAKNRWALHLACSSIVDHCISSMFWHCDADCEYTRSRSAREEACNCR